VRVASVPVLSQRFQVLAGFDRLLELARRILLKIHNSKMENAYSTFANALAAVIAFGIAPRDRVTRTSWVKALWRCSGTSE